MVTRSEAEMIQVQCLSKKWAVKQQSHPTERYKLMAKKYAGAGEELDEAALCAGPHEEAGGQRAERPGSFSHNWADC